MKKITSVLLIAAVLVVGLAGCGKSSSQGDKKKIVIGATPVPHAEILEKIKPILEKDGYTLEIKTFNDYVQPNLSVEDGDLDANFFQHVPYLQKFNKEKGTHLVDVVKVHIEPMGVYSKKIKKLKELKSGATIAIPNDPTNESRSLKILEKEGLIKLKDGDNLTKLDVTENSKKLQFKELDAAQLPRVLDDVDAAVINTNYAIQANLNPLKDAIAIEAKDSPYANVLVVKKGNENKPYVKELAKALNSSTVKKFINDKYKGSIVPAF